MSVRIQGNVTLGIDPELKEWPDGTEYVRFSAASNESWKDGQTGERRERTTWLRCTLSGNRAHVIDDYVSKGQTIWISGTLQPDPETGGPRIWYDDEGEPRASYEVRVRDFEFVSGGSPGGGSSRSSKQEQEDDEIPW